jgi:hypothetical protein
MRMLYKLGLSAAASGQTDFGAAMQQQQRRRAGLTAASARALDANALVR